MQSRTDNQSAKQPHNSLRPMREIVIHLSCGCHVPLASDKEIAPQANTVLWCFAHMMNVRVDWVETRR